MSIASVIPDKYSIRHRSTRGPAERVNKFASDIRRWDTHRHRIDFALFIVRYRVRSVPQQLNVATCKNKGLFIWFMLITRVLLVQG